MIRNLQRIREVSPTVTRVVLSPGFGSDTIHTEHPSPQREHPAAQREHPAPQHERATPETRKPKPKPEETPAPKPKVAVPQKQP